MMKLSAPQTARVWSRRARKEAGWPERARFHGVILGSLLWGVVVNFLVAFSLSGLMSSVPLWGVLGVYALCVWGGGRLMLLSKSALVSFGGLSLAVCPLGLVLQRVFGVQGDDFVMQVLFVMGGFVCAQGVLALALGLLGLGRSAWGPSGVLWGGVLVGVAVDVFFAVSVGSLSVWHWLVLLFMQGRVALYWSKAMGLSPTVDTGVDVVGALVVDSVSPVYYGFALFSLRGGRVRGVRGGG